MKQYLTYTNEKNVLRENLCEDLLYLTYPLLEETGFVHHGFSTRLGGVSEGIFSSMNLSFSRGDEEEKVRENFRRMANALGVKEDSFVFSVQTHTVNVIEVTAEDRGKGITRPVDYKDVDGMVTNVPGLCLTTFYADCVPLYFVDPVHKAIGLSHSGWRGTVGKIGKRTVEAMKKAYGTEEKDLLAAIGPSICQSCYEVSEDVILEFQQAFDEKYWEQLYYKKEHGKYQLDLWKANEIILMEAGLHKEHIAVTNVCTCCNPEVLFSHRASKGQRGSLAAFMEIKEEETC